jgi:hypothetical protein
MKYEVIINGEKRQVEMKGLKGKEVDALYEDMAKLEASSNAGLESIKFIAKVKESASKSSGLSVAELDELDSEDRNKLMGHIVQKIKSNLGFFQS